MSFLFRHHVSSSTPNAGVPDPLPDEFGAELARLDAQLGRDAADRSRDVPTGLGERLFAASVQHLPSRRSEKRGLRFSETPLLRAALWPRLALAACLGLAFIIAAIALYTPGPRAAGVPEGFTTLEPVSPGDGPGPARLVTGRLDRPEALTPDEERLLFGAEVAYLLDTRDLTLAELAADVDSMLRELEG